MQAGLEPQTPVIVATIVEISFHHPSLAIQEIQGHLIVQCVQL